jgi:hypothetical protein
MEMPTCIRATKKLRAAVAAVTLFIPLIVICSFCFSADPQAVSQTMDIAVINLSIEKVQRVLV